MKSKSGKLRWCCCFIPWARMLGLRETSFRKPQIDHGILYDHNILDHHSDINSSRKSMAPSLTNGGQHNGVVSGAIESDHAVTSHLNGYTSFNYNNTNEKSTTTSQAHYVSNHGDFRTTQVTNNGLHIDKTLSSEQHITILRTTIRTSRSKLISDLARFDDEYIDSMTIEAFLQNIETERLTSMPTRGSRFDRCLKWAEFFALQISQYQHVLQHSTLHSEQAAQLIYACCRSLIEVRNMNVDHFKADPLAWTQKCTSNRGRLRSSS